MNKFEKFVKENRDEFDNENPSLKIKETILESVKLSHKSKHNKIFRYWLAAAAIIVFVIINIGVLEFNNSPGKMLSDQLSLLAPEYLETDIFYKKQINLAKGKLQTNNNGSEIIRDVEEIDDMITELKEELVVAPNDRKIVLANRIISGYRTQMKILKKVSQNNIKYL